MGINPFKSIERKIKSGFNKLGDSIRKGLNKAGDEIEGGLKKTGDEIEGGVKKVGREVEGGVKKTGREIEGGLKKAGEDIKRELEKTIQELGKALTSEALKKVRAIANVTFRELAKLEHSKPHLVDEINKVSFTAELGPVTATYAGFYARAEDISSLLSKPPAFTRTGIREFMEGVVPSSVDLGISVQLVAVVVGSKEFGIGGKVGKISGRLSVEILDAILDAAGVPE